MISRRKGAGGRRRERWPSKIDSNWGKHCCCFWFSKKWPSNRIENDRRIFEHPQHCSSWIMKEDLGKRVLCVRVCFVPHSLIPAHPQGCKCFANFWPTKCHNPLSPPLISRCISVRLFSAPQVENYIKKTPICGRCWDPLRQRFPNFFQVRTTFISQNLLRTTLCCPLRKQIVWDSQLQCVIRNSR
jgi:hypothetical protein